jgi:alkyl sulfatase BDS1-like metallo-beta-lactamase superfamily hydrolase
MGTVPEGRRYDPRDIGHEERGTMTQLDFTDRQDFADAERGLLGTLEPCVITDDTGHVVWDNDTYAQFLASECPDTVHPSLWRQSQLCAMQGLYEVTDGIYQVRGLDLSNMTLVESDNGVIVIDPLISKETAAAALALYRSHRGDRPVTAVIYTHAHVDHFGGVHGVYQSEVPIYAGDGFMEAAVAENVYAGTAMSRRANYMYGALIDRSPTGSVGAGLGMTTSLGTVGLLTPTVDITETGQEEIIDGVRVVFQMTPGTECPVEMNFLFPDHRALCMAENATHNLHNILTLRGAVVRDARIWSRYLNETMDLFLAGTDLAFASHHWPTWGSDRVRTYLTQQRDLYAYLHDQTLRYMNQGFTGVEIAEIMEMPPALERAWHARGYYGSVSHNVRAIYQRYLGWFDGNPANLWPHPPVESGTRYVECMGGAAEVIAKARRYADDGDLRFAAQLLNHVVFADETDTEAKELLASVYDRLGWGAENGTWRNFYLQGAAELREGVTGAPVNTVGPEMLAALSVEQVFDSIAILVNGPRAWDVSLAIDWVFTDLEATYRTSLSNGVLIQDKDPREGDADLTIRLTKPQLLGLLRGRGLDEIEMTGDTDVVGKLLGVLDRPDPQFPIVTP